jgi:formylglycine-generating enzyme required for sulfatase activity
MGSRGFHAPAEPIHRVQIAESFWMTETPVTQ